jgi:hypothetical protein
MLDSISNSSYTPSHLDRRTLADGASVNQQSKQEGAQGDEDTPIRQPHQTSENSRLGSEEENLLRELKRRDQQVRAHEQAHVSAGGRFIRSGAQFSYQTGPDGRRYAVGGEVSIDSSPVPGDPEATIRKQEAVARAALAPADPSPQDRTVAATARQVIAQARVELARMRMEENAQIPGNEQPRTESISSPTGGLFGSSAALHSEPEINLDEVV